jgi:hypothetical protein
MHAETLGLHGQNPIDLPGTQFAARLETAGPAGQALGIDSRIEPQGAWHRLQIALENQLLEDQAQHRRRPRYAQLQEQLATFQAHPLVERAHRQTIATPFTVEARLRRRAGRAATFTGQTPPELPAIAEQAGRPRPDRGHSAQFASATAPAG